MSKRTRLLSTIAIAAAFILASAAMPDTAHAWFHRPSRGAPEVDPSTLSSAIALAMGGLAVLGDKLRRR
ncbi:MAG: hypothetical protein ABIR79_15035 [Candidatus Binatia bacterium]